MELAQSMYQSYLDCGEWGDEVSWKYTGLHMSMVNICNKKAYE